MCGARRAALGAHLGRGARQPRDTSGYLVEIGEPDPDGEETASSSPLTTLTYFVGSTHEAKLYHGLLETVTTPGIETDAGVVQPLTTIKYGEGGRFSSALSADNTTWKLQPADVAGLATGSTAERPTQAVAADAVTAVYTDERRFKTTYTVDRFGYETSRKDPFLTQWTYERDKNGLTTTKTQPAGAGGTANLGVLTTTYKYDDRGNLLTATYPQATADTGDPSETLISETWEYDEDFSQVTRHVDTRGYQTLYERDGYGNAFEVRQQVDIESEEYVDDDPALWVTTKFTYTDPWEALESETTRNLPGGLVELITDPRGIKTKTKYYQFGVLVQRKFFGEFRGFDERDYERKLGSGFASATPKPIIANLRVFGARRAASRRAPWARRSLQRRGLAPQAAR